MEGLLYHKKRCAAVYQQTTAKAKIDKILFTLTKVNVCTSIQFPSNFFLIRLLIGMVDTNWQTFPTFCLKGFFGITGYRGNFLPLLHEEHSVT